MHMYRSSMGDLSTISMNETYDLVLDESLEGDEKYIYSYVVVMFTWIIFILNTFILTMVFMNFIIAVIGESY